MLFFLTCSLPEELCKSWQTVCSAQKEWKHMIWRLHQMHILSLPLHLFFLTYHTFRISGVFQLKLQLRKMALSILFPMISCIHKAYVIMVGQQHLWFNYPLDFFLVFFIFLSNKERWSGSPKKTSRKTFKWLVTEWLPVDCAISHFCWWDQVWMHSMALSTFGHVTFASSYDPETVYAVCMLLNHS